MVIEMVDRTSFEKKFRVTPGCWIWEGFKNAYGYGQIYVNGRRPMAHRLSYELYAGEIPDGLWVLHRCDNPACINPDHLFLGTNSDNMKDMYAKKRNTKNGYPPLNYLLTKKLSDAQVLAIREDKRPLSQIAASYGIHKSYAGKLRAQQKRRDVK